MEIKTNVIRFLQSKKIPFTPHQYPSNQTFLEGEEVAKLLQQNPSKVFKTLVTRAKKEYYVFLLPVDQTLDIKKAAKVIQQKSIELVKVEELFLLTGYLRGACSPIGMKKSFPTIIDKKATKLETIFVSGGTFGLQIELSPLSLFHILKVQFADICIEGENHV